MELEEDEGQICRLCGQCESIYIDVFGEEGAKRLLGLKIHSKINILIDERDPLPKTICVQCLGKLEFVCDFQEECLRTQHLLRDRYNLPPLTDVNEIKLEDISPNTSSTNGNNSNERVNHPNHESVADDDQHTSKHGTKSQRNLRSRQSTPENLNKDETGETARVPDADRPEESQNSKSSDTTSSRRLRSKGGTENANSETNSEKESDVPIANRLRSHDSTGSNTRTSENINGSVNEQACQEDESMIQIPTSTLNKILTNVGNSSNTEVCVKESRNRNCSTGDISFTVELRKKRSTDIVTVLAKVFPDQGSCLVDPGIAELFENQSDSEIRSILNAAFNRNTKDNNNIEATEFEEIEEQSTVSRNPEELFTMDGDEIQVDENVEHVAVGNQTGYTCRLCRKVYERKDKCIVHIKTHLGIKQYVCILCRAKFVCKSDVMKHIRCSHTNPRPIQCPKCPKRFRSKFDLTEHDNVHKGVKPYRCPDCGQSYHHKVSLQMHVKSHLPPQNLACEYCGKVFPFRTRLLSHVTSVHLKKGRNFRCHFCYNPYSSLTVLNEHIKTRHTATHTCDVCGKSFKVASKYKAHVLQHTNPKPFVCNVCNNRYASKAFLNEHLLKHEGLRKHVCQKCGASFAQASHLAAHRHVHGEKKHACPECGRKFNRQDNMKVHRKRHFDEVKKTDGKQRGLLMNGNISNLPIEK